MPAEATLYREVVAFLRELYQEGFVQGADSDAVGGAPSTRKGKGRGVLQLELVRLCQRLCSSAKALAHSLETLAGREQITRAYRARARALAKAARRVTRHGKLAALDEVLAEHDDRIIVFSEHLPTLELIAARVEKLGRRPVIYEGALSRSERAKRLAAFRSDERAVLVATRAGTEGLNLQFCNVLVNYELPWNPMVVEQRIGRIHRIGQTREAHIVNFAAHGTIEAHVLQLLDQKIQLFELVVGELDVILGDFGGAESLEEQLTEAWLGAESDEAFAQRLEAIGERIVQSRMAGVAQERLNTEMAGDDNAARLAREFRTLSIAQRLRLGYGTGHVRLARGVEQKRHRLALHVAEIMEALERTTATADAGVDPEHGPLRVVRGQTSTGRHLSLTVQGDELPMMIVDVDADSVDGPFDGAA